VSAQTAAVVDATTTGTERDAASGRRDDATAFGERLVQKILTVECAFRLHSGANLREHWAVKAQRVKKTRQWTRLALKGRPAREWALCFLPLRHDFMRCRLTRCGPRALDGDNLQAAFKAVRDEVAEWANMDDGSPRWLWEYAQEPGQGGFRIELEAL